MGAPVHGTDPTMDPLVLQPMFGSWDPWVHSSMGRTQLVMLIPFLAPMGAPSSMGQTQQWDPLISAPHF